MAAARIHADRDIRDQPDAHALLARIALSRREALCREPLREHVELDFPRVRRREVRRSRCHRRAPILWPIAPIPLCLRLRRPMAVERLERRVLAQSPAARLHEAEKVAGGTVAP